MTYEAAIAEANRLANAYNLARSNGAPEMQVKFLARKYAAHCKKIGFDPNK